MDFAICDIQGWRHPKLKVDPRLRVDGGPIYFSGAPIPHSSSGNPAWANSVLTTGNLAKVRISPEDLLLSVSGKWPKSLGASGKHVHLP